MPENKRLFIVIALSCLVIILWHAVIVPNFIGYPTASLSSFPTSHLASDNFLDYTTAISTDVPKVRFKNAKVEGFINLKGPKLDDIDLLDYRVAIDNPQSVKLLMPSGMKNSYFVEHGWLVEGEKIIPNSAIWEVIESNERTATLFWQNELGMEFYIDIKLNDDYMFEVTQTVINKTDQPFSFNLYSRLHRRYSKKSEEEHIQFEEVLGVFDKRLVEVKLSKLSSKPLRYNITSSLDERKWAAFSDKYWAVALIPPLHIEGEVEMQSINDKMQLSFISKDIIIEKGESIEFTNHLFIGSKELHLLDKYSKNLKINLFNRLVYSGILYPVTKPILIILIFLKKYLGNFGLAILFFTVLVKLALLPIYLNNNVAMQKSRQLQPQEKRLKELYKDDPIKLYKERALLYKKSNAKPMAGCLALLLQAPILLGLFNLLKVTIEMRHAPFYGWIHDLSEPDPTNIINLFGFIPWDPPAFLQIGVWPVLLGICILLHEKLRRDNTLLNEETKNMLRIVTYSAIFMMAQLPSGLIIYFTWSTLLSILQDLAFRSKTVKHYLANRNSTKPKLIR